MPKNHNSWQSYMPIFIKRNYFLMNLLFEEYVSIGFFYYIITLLISIGGHIFGNSWINYLFTFKACVLVCFIPKQVKYLKYSFQSGFLGFSQGLLLRLLFQNISTEYVVFLIYLNILIFFHISEFLFTGMANPRSINTSSFLLDHSVPYWVAASSSWIEYGTEYYFFQTYKPFNISVVGILLCLSGEFIRKCAIIQASKGFTHIVANQKLSQHKLVTHGVYSYVRHPAYLGWFLWSVGTQVTLCNPVCIILYMILTWKFFAERINEEEMYLIDFFSDTYRKYQSMVPSGIPFVKGYMC